MQQVAAADFAGHEAKGAATFIATCKKLSEFDRDALASDLADLRTLKEVR